MGKPETLLEGLCGHALKFDAHWIEVEYQDGKEWVYTQIDNQRVSVAKYEKSSSDGQELLGNLYAAAKKTVRTVLNGKVHLLKVSVSQRSDEDFFAVSIDPAPPLDPSAPPKFTAKQGQYLAYIHNYTKIHRQAPAESDLQRYFDVSAPSIHNMIKTLELNGLIEKTPGQARTIRLCVKPEHLPPLD